MGYVRDLAARTSKPRTYLAQAVQKAREWIYKSAYPIGSEKVERLLKPTSSVPTKVRPPELFNDSIFISVSERGY
jgi:hypothetical protein